MKKFIYPILALSLLLTSAGIRISATEYKIKENHSIKFSSKDPSGVFKKLNGTINFSAKDLENSSFKLTIDVASISTGNSMKNKKALTSEWFSAAKYPKIKFVSTKIVKDENGYRVHGNLTMKGKTRFRKIPMKVEKTKSGTRFTGSFWVDRSFYKIGKPSKATPNKLKISYIIPVTKK